MNETGKLLEFEKQSGILIVNACSDLGEETYEQLTREADGIYQEIENDDSIRSALVDCTHIEYVGSTAISVFLGIWKRISKRGGRFGLCAANNHVDEIIRCCNLHTIWPLFATREDALAELGKTQ